ncbi:hypothetical protein San01_31260 [Streptomyces angustmyceticus]|uniref:Uncharacterized protein n=1 Tax=Streptomyces angustmyceticus TaxID=285578 RepID=A0A5J4LG15_9ACTN|nr:hypothetical protein San01_31260 [Streptomyces angustmyceticus]
MQIHRPEQQSAEQTADRDEQIEAVRPAGGGVGWGGHPSIKHGRGVRCLHVRGIAVSRALHRKMQSRIIARDDVKGGGRWKA